MCGRARNRRAGVLWGFGLLLATGCGSPLPPDDGRAIASRFLELIRERQAADAWQSTSAEFKSDTGREEFLRFVRRSPVLQQPLRFHSFQLLPDASVPLAECVFHPPDGPQTGKTVRVLLGREDDQWKVERLLLDAAADERKS
jgi:hypothetical protein